MYGLKDSPRVWEDYFAEELVHLGGARFKSDGNVYYFGKYSTYLLVYVDDLMAVGEQPQRLMEEIQTKVTLNILMNLKAGTTG